MAARPYVWSVELGWNSGEAKYVELVSSGGKARNAELASNRLADLAFGGDVAGSAELVLSGGDVGSAELVDLASGGNEVRSTELRSNGGEAGRASQSLRLAATRLGELSRCSVLLCEAYDGQLN